MHRYTLEITYLDGRNPKSLQVDASDDGDALRRCRFLVFPQRGQIGRVLNRRGDLVGQIDSTNR